MRRNPNKWILCTGVALLLFSIYLFTMTGRPFTSDERYLVDAVSSIAIDGDTEIDRTLYIRGLAPLIIEPGQPLLAVPLYWITYQIPFIGNSHGLMLFNPIVTALTGGLMVAYLLELGYSKRSAVAGALLFGMTTLVLFYTSTFFRESANMLAFVGAAYSYQRWRKVENPWIGVIWLIAGTAALFMAFLIKEASLVTIPFILMMAYTDRHITIKSFSLLMSGAVIAVGIVLAIVLLASEPFGILDTVRYDIPGRAGDAIDGLPWVIRGVSGFLFSPGRSIWVYSPVLILALAAPFLLSRSQWRESWLIGAMVIVNAIMFAAVRQGDWYGGWGWGARYMVPLLPFLMVAAMPLIDRIIYSRHWWDKTLLGGLAAFGMAHNILSSIVRTSDYYRILITETGLPIDSTLAFWSFRWAPAFGIFRYIPQLRMNVLWFFSDAPFLMAVLLIGVIGLGMAALLRIYRGGAGWLLLPWGLAVAAMVLILLLTTFNDRRFRGDQVALHNMLDVIEAKIEPGDVVILNSDYAARFFDNYYKEPNRWYGLPENCVAGYGSQLNETGREVLRDLLVQSVVEGAPSRLFIVMYTDPDNPCQALEDILRRRNFPISKKQYASRLSLLIVYLRE